MRVAYLEQRYSEEDRTTLMQLYSDLNSISKKKTKLENQKVREHKRALRDKISEYAYMFFKVRVVLGPKVITLPWETTRHSAVAIKKELTNALKKIREDRRKLKVKNEIDGSFGIYKYKTIGNVFNKSNSIIELQSKISERQKINLEKKPHIKIKDNYVGVEIECVMKCSREDLANKLADAKLGSYVCVKGDGSISPTDTHPVTCEITLLMKYGMSEEIINRLDAVLKDKSVDAKANNSCGLHVHLDMRNRDVSKSYLNLFHSQTILLGMLPQTRRSSFSRHAEQYCRRNDKDSFSEQQKAGRYYAINAQAYSKFKTLEVRVHSGTTNAKKIINWISLLTTVVDSMESPDVTFRSIENFSRFFNISSSIKEYVIKRTAKFENKVDTEQDEATPDVA